MPDTPSQKSVSFAPKVTAPKQERPRLWRLSAMIGIGAGLATSLLVIWVLFFQSDNNIEIELTNVSTTQTGQLELQGLTYRGQTASGDKYMLNAERDSEDAQDANLVNLTVLDGEILHTENGRITISSYQGHFHQTQNTLALKGNVIITQSARKLVFTTSHLTGDLDAGNFDAPESVSVKSPTSHITAEAMVVTDFGDKIIFKGQSKALIGEEDKS